jgi:glycosyltransferase involved in cell wall biosynthesis
MKKKILIASDEIYPFGWGIGKYAILLQEELINQGHECKLIGTYSHNNSQIFSYSSNLGFQSKKNLIKKFFITVFYTLKFKPQIILCVHSSSVLMFNYLSILGLFNKTKKVIVFHGSDIQKLKQTISLKRLNKNFDKYISISKYVELKAYESLNIKTKTIYNTVERKYFKKSIKRFNKIEQKCNIIMVGRLDNRKNHTLLIDSIGMLDKDKRTQFDVKLIGNGPHSNSIESVIKNNKLNDFITVLKNINDSELERIYTNTNFLIFPSIELEGRVEGFGLVVLESILMGVLPILTPSGGQLEIVGDDYPLIINNSAELHDILTNLDNFNLEKIYLNLFKRVDKFHPDLFGHNYSKFLSK